METEKLVCTVVMIPIFTESSEFYDKQSKCFGGMCRRWRFTSQVWCVENLWRNDWVSVVCPLIEGVVGEVTSKI